MAIFRRGVDGLLDGDKKLRALLGWADKRSTLIPKGRSDVRQFSLYLSGYLSTRNLVRYRSSYYLDSRAKDLAKHHTSYALDYYLISALYAAADLIGANTENDYIALAHDLVFDIANERNNASICARKLGLLELDHDIESLPRPAEGSSRNEAARFAEKWRDLTIKHRDIGHNWSFTREQAERLINYLNANELLKDCLELAFMPPDEKEAMLNSLYLPPPEADGRENA